MRDWGSNPPPATNLKLHIFNNSTDSLPKLNGERPYPCLNKLLAESEDTVKGHMRNVLLKLQANDRTHASLSC